MAILSRLGARGGGEWESASICSSATVGSLNKIWKNAQTSDFLNNTIFIIWMWIVRNCEKLVFLVLSIVKHIFLAVLYFWQLALEKLLKCIQTLWIPSCWELWKKLKSASPLLIHPSVLSHRVDSQPNSMQCFLQWTLSEICLLYQLFWQDKRKGPDLTELYSPFWSHLRNEETLALSEV